MNKIKALLGYYLALSLVFLCGRYYIISTYNMKQGPVPTEAFRHLFDWVQLFSYLFIVPLLIIGLIGIIRFTKKKNLSVALRILIGVLYLPIASGVGIVLAFLFTLLFYGFAP